MRKPLVWLAGLLLCPAWAGAETRYHSDYVEQPFWLGVGFGGGRVNSAAPAPSAGRDAFSFTIDAGMRITPKWGIGLEYGRIAPNGGCGGHHCTPADHDFAPDFSHWFLVAEHRSGEDGGLRLRAGLGVSSMCDHYYKTNGSSFWGFVLAVVFDDESYDSSIRHWECDSLQAFGASASIGYQWSLPDSGSIGLQLRGEAANFAANSSAGTPKFRHRAVTMQIQLNVD